MKNKFKPTHRSFCFLKTLDYYIAKEYLIILILCLTLLFGVRLIIELSEHLQHFLQAPNSTFTSGVDYFLSIQIVHIETFVPMSLLLSCIYFVGKMHGHNEITAMRSAGISLFRSTFGIYIISLLLIGITLLLNFNIIPQWKFKCMLNEKSRYFGNYIKEVYAKSIFYKSQDKLWYIESFNNFNELSGIHLKKTNSKENYQLVLKAPKAIYSEKVGWEFLNATITKYSSDYITLTNNIDKPPVQYSINIPNHPVVTNHDLFNMNSLEYKDFGDFSDTPDDIINLIKHPSHIPINYIIRYIKSDKKTNLKYRNRFKTELYSRLVSPFLLIFVIAIIITMIGKNNRRSYSFIKLKAFIVIILYMSLSKSLAPLGYSGVMPPLLAVIFPAFIMIPLLYYQQRLR
jgi:lipopolysaccharide export system permease protein